MNARCNSHPIWERAKIIFALPAALTAALLLTTVQPAAAQPGWVLSHQKISDTEGGFTGMLDDHDIFGRSAASLGDLDGDGVGDLAVGAMWDDDGGRDRGAMWVLFLNRDGTVKSHQKISDTEGGFTGSLRDSDWFGISVASLGDLDGNGVADLAVGAFLDDDGGFNHGAVWVLFLNTDGTVKAHQKISDTEGGFIGILGHSDWFGSSAASLGDLDGDGVGDLAVGAFLDDDGGQDRGAIWMLFLNADGTVKAHQKISDTEGGFPGTLDNSDHFGSAVASLGDLDGDGVGDLAVGAEADDDGGGQNSNRGAVWILFLNADGTVKAHQKISDTEGGFAATLSPNDRFGVSVASLGDFDGDGVADLAVGAHAMTMGARTAARCGCCFSTPTARSSRTRKSATHKAASPAPWTRTICSASRWPHWVISTATEWATWLWGQTPMTMGARTAVRCGCCSSTASPPATPATRTATARLT